MDIPDRSVDAIVAISSLEHFPVKSFYNCLVKLSSIIKDDGYFIVTLDMTIDKSRSARWAILEKTYNGLPEQENDIPLEDRHKQIDLQAFIAMIGEYFVTDQINDVKITDCSNLTKYVYSDEWNSIVGYLKLRKKIV